jgi:PAS domain S-box-containing protein
MNSLEVEASLRKEMSFRKAIEKAIPSGIAVVDDTGKQVYVNKSFCEMVGWDEEELLGKRPPYAYWSEQDMDNINIALEQTLNNNVPKEGFDLVFCNKDGRLIPVHVIITSFVPENDKTFWLANVIDLTERKQAEAALKESETKFKEVINQINDGIIAFDEQGKISIWNQGAENISGLIADDTLNKNIVDIRYQFTPPELRNKAQIENTIESIVKFKTPEAFNKIVDNEIISLNTPNIRNVQSTVFPIRLDGYNLFCAVIRDTTELKRYEKELLHISAEKDKFYSTIAQYLYTPFNLFNSFSKLMADELDNLSIKEIQKMAAMMSKSATNLYSLLDNLLQWTRINQGKISFEPQKLNFIKTCQDAVSILRPNAEAKNITIDHSAPEGIVVFADIFMFKTILRNLVSHSIRFVHNGGAINISAEQADSDVLISVSDNGIGITPDYKNKLFNISHINTGSDNAEENGTTLGLLLCKEFVEKHGGKIWMESENGKGNVFKFTLPAS